MPDSFSFPKEKRLLERTDYQQVFESQNKLVGSFCIIFYLKNELSHPRLGLAVTKKSLPRAAHRNTFKRVVRESFRRYQHLLPAVDIVVLTRKSVSLTDISEFFKGLERTWESLAKRYKAVS